MANNKSNDFDFASKTLSYTPKTLSYNWMFRSLLRPGHSGAWLSWVLPPRGARLAQQRNCQKTLPYMMTRWAENIFHQNPVHVQTHAPRRGRSTPQKIWNRCTVPQIVEGAPNRAEVVTASHGVPIHHGSNPRLCPRAREASHISPQGYRTRGIVKVAPPIVMRVLGISCALCLCKHTKTFATRSILLIGRLADWPIGRFADWPIG